jgi:hypothetical protein
VVGVVTAASRIDPALCVLLNQDQEVGDGFDEPDERTHAMPYHPPLAGRRAPRMVVAW